MNKNIKKVNVKKVIWLVLLSYGINLAALFILMLKVFYPHYRILAFTIYGVSWAIFIYALYLALFKKYKQHKHLFLQWFPLLGISFGLLFTLWMIGSLFPLNNFEIAQSDKEALMKKMNSEQIYTEKYIQKMKDAESLLLGQLRQNSLNSLTVADKNKIRELWRDYLSYFMALNEIIEQYKYFYQINYLTDRDLNERSFVLAYASFLSVYSSSLNLVEDIENNPLSETLLNEEVLSYDIPGNAYYTIQKNLLRPENNFQAVAGYPYLQKIKQDELSILKSYAESDFKNILVKTGTSPDIAINGAADYFEKNMFIAWFPVQKQVAQKMGDTKIPLSDVVMVDLEKIKEIEKGVLPGDIFLQRRNWYLSNIGLPGFWKHTAIYIGSLDDLDRSFDPSDLTQGLKMSEYMKNNFPKLYEELKDGKKRTLEAESEGVVSFTLEKSMSADYAAVLRPKISQEEKLRALIYAFKQFGKPYDFDFDFLTDNAIVCSELYYKAYPMMGHELRMVSGRMVLSANDVAQDFDKKYEEKNNLFELVYFIDSNEGTKKSFFSDLIAFRESWKRNEADVVKSFILKNN